MHPWPLPATAMRSVPSSACLCALLMGVGGSPLESLGWKAPERTVLRARDEGEHAGLWHSVGRGMENADESRWSAAADAWVSADTLRVIKCSALGRRREGATTTLRLPRRTLFFFVFLPRLLRLLPVSLSQTPCSPAGQSFRVRLACASFFRAGVLGPASCSAGCLRRRAVSLLAPPPPEDIEDGGVGFGFPRCCLSTTYLSSAARSRRSKRCAVTNLFPPFFVLIYYSV